MSSARAFAFVSCLAALAALGCGSGEHAGSTAQAPAEPAAAEPAAPAEPGQEAPAAALPEPEVAWQDNLPSDFPSDVPRYPNSKVGNASGTDDMGFAITFGTSDPIDKVAGFYVDGFAAQGWQAERQSTPEGTMVFASKDDRAAQALVHAAPEGTRVELVVAPTK